MYERLMEEPFQGSLLDLGGGLKSDYLSLLSGFQSYASVNISQSVGPSVTGDLEGGLPFKDSSFDCVVSLNTFEHLYGDTDAIFEVARVLKSSGKFVASVPFIYRIHASPFDFNRRTHTWWKRVLSEAGFKIESIKIQPLVWGPISTAYSIVEFGPFRRLIRPLVLTTDLLFFMIQTRNDPARLKYLTRNGDYPVGYFVTASKS